MLEQFPDVDFIKDNYIYNTFINNISTRNSCRLFDGAQFFSYFRRKDQIAKFKLLELNFCSLVKTNGLIRFYFTAPKITGLMVKATSPNIS